jgi:hypothetical protein
MSSAVAIRLYHSRADLILYGTYQHLDFVHRTDFFFFLSSRDGWQYNGDPLRLPAMQFDAYKVKKAFFFAVCGSGSAIILVGWIRIQEGK